MANKPKNMLQIRRIIQLLETGLSKRKIATELGISRNTVDYYVKRIKSTSLGHQELLALALHELSELIYKDEATTRKDSRYERLAPRLGELVTDLGRRGVTRLLLWQEYRQKDPNGYSYQQFCEHLNTYQQVNSSSMRLDHKPGEKLEVDFAGGKMHYVDKLNGEVIECPVLIAVLPFSGYTYAEALTDMSLTHLIPGLSACLEYFQGVASHVVFDNLKQVVKKSNRYEPSFTELALQWSLHYNTALLTTRVGHPKDKPTVEKAVDLAYKRIYAPLRNHVFGNLSELNHHLRECLDKHNGTLLQRRNYSRKELFLQQEHPVLKALPAERFEIKYSVKAKVQKNYHVTLGQDWHHYSVPYQFIGQQATIVYDSRDVEVYIGQKRITYHKRDYRKHGYTTLEEHMPEKHLRYQHTRGWNQEYFINSAQKVGPWFEKAIGHVLKGRQFTQQTFNACLGLLRLENKYGKARLEKASQMAVCANAVSFTTINTILLNNRDRQIDPEPIVFPDHTNIRGAQMYLDF